MFSLSDNLNSLRYRPPYDRLGCPPVPGLTPLPDNRGPLTPSSPTAPSSTPLISPLLDGLLLLRSPRSPPPPEPVPVPPCWPKTSRKKGTRLSIKFQAHHQARPMNNRNTSPADSRPRFRSISALIQELRREREEVRLAGEKPEEELDILTYLLRLKVT